MNYQINCQDPNKVLIELSINELENLGCVLLCECDREGITGEFLDILDTARDAQLDYKKELEIALEREWETKQ